MSNEDIMLSSESCHGSVIYFPPSRHNPREDCKILDIVSDGWLGDCDEDIIVEIEDAE